MNNVNAKRITKCFAAASVKGAVRNKLVIPYITAGDPDLDTTLALMHTLVDAGADIIELGVPFSDPMADGPVVQAACERALAGGTTLVKILDLVARFRTTNSSTAVVLMGYMNPVEALGYVKFAEGASAAGIDGVLIVDLPPEEAGDLLAELGAVNVDAIFLLSPTSPDDRVRAVCESVSGYIYYVSLKGVTGSAGLDIADISSKVANIKRMSNLPVAVGFGIRDADSAVAVAANADAVIVGTALVSLVAQFAEQPKQLHSELFDKVNSMRVALDKTYSSPVTG